MAKILGPDGKPLPPSKPARPETRDIAVPRLTDRWSSYPSYGLTPQKLALILKEADYGDPYRQMELFEEIEEKDGHLTSILGTRKQAVLGIDWEIQPYDADNPDDVKIAEFIKEALEKIPAFEDVQLDLLDAIGKGYSVAEIHWEYRNGRWYAGKLGWIHPKRFRFGDLVSTNLNQIRLLTDEEPAAGIELPASKFIVHRYKARSGHPARAGILRVCSWMYLFKNFSIKDWVAFAEIYGMPFRLGKYGTSATQEDKDALYRALIQLGSDAAGIIPKDAEVEFVEALKNAGGDVFHALAAFANAEMSKAVLGQTLTTEVGDKGSYAASQTHAGVRQDLLEADCKALAETYRQQLIKPLVYFNFGPAAADRLPWMRFMYEPPEDLQQTANTYKTVIVDIGLPVAQEHLYQKFGIPKPEEGQTLVVPTQQVVAPPGPGAQAPVAPGQTETLSLAERQRVPREPVDNLADAAAAQAKDLLADLAAPVRELIQNSGSLEEIREKLPGLYRQMDTGRLEELLQRVLYAADMYGRWTVTRNG